ncbi:MAG: DNA polymerase IV [Oscillospiraceae bacterium]|nr:DNA polymerase IV [Oscillospiraceae bacterium]
MARIVLHCDLNSFYASVELLSYPQYRTLPVAVCGDPAARHGIILAKNEPAKRYGIRTAETVWQAKKKCPDLILLPPHHDLYAEYSRRVNAIYAEYTDLVEPFGIDESWLDITNTLHLFHCDAVTLANTIRARIKGELGLTLSVGVSFNKVFAKLGSDYKKPDATTLISEENWRDMVRPLPVGDLLFVGRAAKEVLAKYDIRTIGDLADAPQEMLETLLGKLGTQLHRYANGLDDDPVRGIAEREPIKSVGNGTTFKRDLTTRDDIRTGISILADSVAMRLRRHGLYCSGVQVLLRNSQFKNISRQKQLDHPTHLMREIADAAMELAEGAWHAPEPIRMITVTAINLSSEGSTYCQLDLLGSPEETQTRQEKVEDAMEKIRQKYGKGAISYATPAKPALRGEEEE